MSPATIEAVQNILDFLKTTPDQITVSRVPPVGRSADSLVARRLSLDLLRNPRYVARGGVGEMGITRAELDALRAAGAMLRGPLHY